MADAPMPRMDDAARPGFSFACDFVRLAWRHELELSLGCHIFGFPLWGFYYSDYREKEGSLNLIPVCADLNIVHWLKVQYQHVKRTQNMLYFAVV